LEKLPKPQRKDRGELFSWQNNRLVRRIKNLKELTISIFS